MGNILLNGEIMKPNILFLFPDQWRGDWLGESQIGKLINTPAIDSLIKKGTTFTRAMSPSPLCAPARACIATGSNYPAHNVVNNKQDLPLNAPTFYRELRSNGYYVMGCGKFDLHKNSFSWGRDGKHLLTEWGFSDGIDNEGKLDGIASYNMDQVGPYMNFLEEKGKHSVHIEDYSKRKKSGTFPTELEDDEYCDNWLTNNAIKLLDSAPQDKPWFLQVNFTGPHEPFDVTKKMHSLYKEVEFPEPMGNFQDLDFNLKRQNYAAMMENIDTNIDKILNHPRVKNDLDNTVIIFSSDHGDMMGDHGFYAKLLPYNGSVHVPLVISGKEIKSGQVNSPVTILDIPGTILNIAGIKDENYNDSLSLLPLIDEGDCKRKIVTSALYIPNNPLRQWRMAQNSSYKYIYWLDGNEAVFSVNDYEESNNLIDKMPLEAVELKEYLKEIYN